MVRRQGRHQAQHRAKRSRGSTLLRGGVAIVVVGGLVLAITAFGPRYLERVWSTATADQRFVAAVQAQGHAAPTGENEVLVVRAAQKLCERRDGTTNSAQLRSTALTADEVDAVRRTFGDDSQAFLKVALRSYCPLSP